MNRGTLDVVTRHFHEQIKGYLASSLLRQHIPALQVVAGRDTNVEHGYTNMLLANAGVGFVTHVTTLPVSCRGQFRNARNNTPNQM